MVCSRQTAAMQLVPTGGFIENQKPTDVTDYNKHKAGLDLFEQKWRRKLAFLCITMTLCPECA
ncbi:hypothetical protein C0J52_03112 [Blattella germanica]|nr:hypothetical protein C0J52_03112 [Blattella germanica]